MAVELYFNDQAFPEQTWPGRRDEDEPVDQQL